MKTVVFTWGRANPITEGHEVLVDAVKAFAEQYKADAKVFLTHTQDAKRNPLSFDEKYFFAHKTFGNIVQVHEHKTIIQAMQALQENYDHVHLIVGSDRQEEFNTMLNKYNNKEYKFESISVHSAGLRDPDQATVAGVSASKMRELAQEGLIDEFVSLAPKKLPLLLAQEMFHATRRGMLQEETTTDAIEGPDPFILTNLRQLYFHLLNLKRRRQFAAYRDIV